MLASLTSPWHILGVISMCNYVILCWRHWRRLDISSVWLLCVAMRYYIDVIDVVLTYPRCDFYVKLRYIILASLTSPWHILGVISMWNYVILCWRHWRRLDISPVRFLCVAICDIVLTSLTSPWHILGVISMCNYGILCWRHWRRLDILSVRFLCVAICDIV